MTPKQGVTHNMEVRCSVQLLASLVAPWLLAFLVAPGRSWLLLAAPALSTVVLRCPDPTARASGRAFPRLEAHLSLIIGRVQ